ncbi:MAG: DUF1844 domain-containing protein [Candidatus Omnitrophota bacterium]
MIDTQKAVDEGWKESAQKEKTVFGDKKDSRGFVPPEASFAFFLNTLAIQAAVFLGDIPNPANNQKEENIPQAKFIIDTLSMLKEKTTGNLSTDEESLLDNILYDLRGRYIKKSKE